MIYLLAIIGTIIFVEGVRELSDLKKKVLVKKNEVVTKGQKIGSMAEKANDSKNQTILHFELRRGTQSVNPENYFE